MGWRPLGVGLVCVCGARRFRRLKHERKHCSVQCTERDFCPFVRSVQRHYTVFSKPINDEMEDERPYPQSPQDPQAPCRLGQSALFGVPSLIGAFRLRHHYHHHAQRAHIHHIFGMHRKQTIRRLCTDECHSVRRHLDWHQRSR